MASLREAARRVLDEARNGILWIAVWKEGRGWHCESIPGVEYTESNPHGHTDERWDIDEEALEELNEILAVDPEAILVNGYYRNIGYLEEMTLASLVDGLRFQYEMGGNMKEIVNGVQGEEADGANGADNDSERAEEDRADESSAADLRQGADSGSGEKTGAIRIGCKRINIQLPWAAETVADDNVEREMRILWKGNAHTAVRASRHKVRGDTHTEGSTRAVTGVCG